MKLFRFTFLLIGLFVFGFSLGQNHQLNRLNEQKVWSATELENPFLHEGLAGGYFGKYQDKYIWAGGSFFPEGKPWEGGRKYFSLQIFVFEKKSGKFSLLHQSDQMPQAMAEGAYVSTEKGVLCIGGQTPHGISDSVFLISFNNKKIEITHLPPLPEAVKSATATAIGQTIYVLGGQKADGTSVKSFLQLDLQKPENGWTPLPDYPLPVSSVALTTQQNGHETSIFAFGGRSLTDKITHFYSEVYRFSPSKKTWEKKKNIHISNQEMPLAASISAKVGASNILLIGGDNGQTYNKVEQAINSNNTKLRDSLWIHHNGFQPKIIAYNTITDQWFDVQNTQMPRAVSSVFSDGQTIFIAGGEQKPGIRSAIISEIQFEKSVGFGWINYLVLILYFGGMLFVGFLFMKNNNNTDDYFKASGRIPWWAAGISIFATTLSAITFISIPAKTYATDWRMFLFSMTIILSVPIVIRYFLPFFVRFNFSTAYEYLEKRFNRPIRWIASALFVFFMVSRIAIVLFLPSLALNAVTGFSVYYAILITSIVTIIYSTSGGMEAVIWGDVIQGFILIAGALAAFVFMILGVEGGLETFWNTTMEHQKFHLLDFRFDFGQPVLWVVLLGGLANTLISYTSDQSVIQRYMTTKNEKATAKSIWLNGILSVPVSVLFFLLGTGLFAFYHSNPSKMVVSNPNIDSIFPQFIVSEMPIGFAGLLIAAIFAAAMSTLSSNINSVSAVVTSDFYKTLVPNSSFSTDMKVARFSGIFVGLLGTLMAIVLATWDIASLWDQFNTFLGLLTSGLGALFILGIFFPRVGSISALIGLTGGTLVLYIVKATTSLSFLLFGLIGMLSCIVLAVVLSLIFPNKKKFDPKLTWKK